MGFIENLCLSFFFSSLSFDSFQLYRESGDAKKSLLIFGIWNEFCYEEKKIQWFPTIIIRLRKNVNNIVEKTIEKIIKRKLKSFGF